MSAEFDDVLTNQPVVIDNVGGASKNEQLLSYPSFYRAQEPLRLVLQARTIRSVSFRLCAS